MKKKSVSHKGKKIEKTKNVTVKPNDEFWDFGLNESQKEDNNEKIIYLTLQQISLFFEVAESEIKKLITLGLPKVSRNKFNALECAEWYFNYLKNRSDNRTTKEMAYMLDISTRWLNKLTNENIIPKEDKGIYNIGETFFHYANYLKKQTELAKAPSKDARIRLINYQADLKQLELLEMQKVLFPVEQAKKMVSEITSLVVKKLEAKAGMELEKKFACRTKEELLKVEKEIIYNIRTDLAKAVFTINDKKE